MKGRAGPKRAPVLGTEAAQKRRTKNVRWAMCSGVGSGFSELSGENDHPVDLKLNSLKHTPLKLKSSEN